jgi:hypothetical protein
VVRTARALAIGLAVVVVVSACTVAEVESPDPAAVPSGEPIAIGAEATGPVTELGSGRVLDLGWRYVIYESADGWCTELQLTEVTSTGCGPDLLPAEGEHIGAAAAHDPLESGATPVDGIVSEEIFTVWVVDEELGRIPATLMPLEEAGLEGQAFVALMPPEATPTHVQALAMSGEVLQTYELP